MREHTRKPYVRTHNTHRASGSRAHRNDRAARQAQDTGRTQGTTLMHKHECRGIITRTLCHHSPLSEARARRQIPSHRSHFPLSTKLLSNKHSAHAPEAPFPVACKGHPRLQARGYDTPGHPIVRPCPLILCMCSLMQAPRQTLPDQPRHWPTYAYALAMPVMQLDLDCRNKEQH